MSKQYQDDAARKAKVHDAEVKVHKSVADYRKSPTAAHEHALIASTGEFSTVAAYDARVLANNAPDSKKDEIIKAELARIKSQYKSEYKGDKAGIALIDDSLDSVQSQLTHETKKERTYQIERYEGLEAVDATGADLKAKTKTLADLSALPSTQLGTADAKAAAEAAVEQASLKYSAAIGNLVDLEIDHQLAGMKPQADGTYSEAQWKEASAAVKSAYNANAEFAAYIDKVAATKGDTNKIDNILDKIQHDPASLHLTPAEQELAKSDPVTLAFARAAGVTINPDDATLSPEMRDIAKKDPLLFVTLSKSNAKIWSDGTPPEVNPEAARLENGKYVHVSVNGKEITLTPTQKAAFDYGRDKASISLGNSVLPNLGLQKNDKLQSLMQGADIVRSRYLDKEMFRLMGGQSQDGDAANKLLKTHLDRFFSPEIRTAFWEQKAKPYMEPWLTARFNAVNPPEINPQAFLTTLADSMNGVLQDASPEMAALVIDAAEKRADAVMADAFAKGEEINGQNSNFLTTLSHAVDIADQRPFIAPGQDAATQVADWLLKDSRPFSMVGMKTSDQVRNIVDQTGEVGLADALVTGISARSGEYVDGFAKDFKSAVEQAKIDSSDKLLGRINKEKYADFMAHADEILHPFFDQFSADPNIGKPVHITSDTQLHDIVGKTLFLTPTDKAAADRLDYTKEWFAEGTAERNIIDAVTKWLRESGLDENATLKALPFKYASQLQGVHDGGLFIVKTASGKETVVDGTAALDAVTVNGGAPIDPSDTHFQWHYDSLKQFQDDNHYDDGGFIYLPTNLEMSDRDNDGHVDYERIRAAITTGREKWETVGVGALGVVGMVLLFTPAAGVGTVLLAGTAAAGIAVSGDNLHRMHSHGADLSWDNPAARQEYMSIAGNTFGLGRVGLLKFAMGNTGRLATTAKGAATLLGAGATYIGFNQTMAAGSALFAGWNYMSWGQRMSGFALFASGLVTTGLGGMKIEGRTTSDLPTRIKNRADELDALTPGNRAKADADARKEILESLVQERAYRIPRAYGDEAARIARAKSEFDSEVTARMTSQGLTHEQAESAVYQEWLTQNPARGRRAPQDWWADRKDAWKTRWAGDPTHPVNVGRAKPLNNYGIRWHEYWDQAKSVGKTFGKTYAWVNGVGLAAWGAWNFGVWEQRTSSIDLTKDNADAELKKLQDDPDKYLDDNYDFAFAGIGLGDALGDQGWVQNYNGHLLAIQNDDGDTYYFRRVPEDLYKALKDAQKARGDDSDKVFVQEVLKDEHGDPVLDDDGHEVKIRVEIRPPYRGEAFRDAGYTQQWETNGNDPGAGDLGKGFRWRPSLAIGPIEGWRPHLDFDLALNHRITLDTATTLRAGAPSPTQGWGVGIRQQDTTLWNRASFSGGTIDLNKSRVYDLTNPSSAFSGAELQIFNGRFYLDTGNRNRVRFDFAGKGTGRGSSTWSPNQVYARGRETGMVELGFGADFLKYVYEGGEYWSVNGYYELQAYPADLRSQVNFMKNGSGTITQTTLGYQEFPLFEIDPAVQFTTTAPPRLFDLPPPLSPEK